MSDLAPGLIVAFLAGVVVSTSVTLLLVLSRRRQRSATAAYAQLRDEWLDPLSNSVHTLADEQRDQARHVAEVQAGLGDVHQALDELGRRFLAVRNEIRWLQDDALEARYRDRLGLPDAGLVPGRVWARHPVNADRILTAYLRATRALDLKTALLNATDGGRHVRVWLRPKSTADSPDDVDRRVREALSEVLAWRHDSVERLWRTASAPTRALADMITALGTQGACFVQLGAAVFVTAANQLAVAVLSERDLAYLEEHHELVTSPERALARMRATLPDRYLDLTPTLHALTSGEARDNGGSR